MKIDEEKQTLQFIDFDVMESCLTDTSIIKQLEAQKIHRHILSIENQNLQLVETLQKVKETTKNIKLSHEYIKSIMLRKAGGANANVDIDGDIDMADLDDEERAQIISQQIMYENLASDKNERATN